MALAMVSFAEEPSTNRIAQSKTNEQNLTNREKFLRATGGFMVDRRNAIGSVAIINAQKRVSSDFVKSRVQALEKNVWMSTVYSVPTNSVSLETIDETVKASKGNIAIVLVELVGLPTLISIPESKCAIVNVYALAKDCKDASVLESRVAKEISRAFCFALVVNYSVRPGGVMDPITSTSELDKVLVDGIGLDLMPYIERSAERFGIKRFKRTTYLKACQEGWAPPPINNIQKAIWEQTRQLPTKPIKIEFDPAKDK